MDLAGAQLRAIDERVDRRFRELAALGTLTASGALVEMRTETEAMVTIDGGTQAVPVKIFRSCVVDEGDRVGLIKIYGYWHVFANYTHKGIWANEFIVNGAFGSENHASTSYTTEASFPTINFTKQNHNTRIEVGIIASNFMGGGSTDTSIWWGVQVDGTDYQDTMINQQYNLSHNRLDDHISQHFYSGGKIYIDGSPISGSQTSLPMFVGVFSLIWRRGIGDRTLNTDASDWHSFWVREVGPETGLV